MERLSEIDRKFLDAVADYPGISRVEAQRLIGTTYWVARRRLDKLFLLGIVDRKRFGGRYRYFIKRERRIVVTSFKFDEDTAIEIGYPIKKIKRPRWIEVIVEVDKPVFINIEPEYVLTVFLDYSAWCFSIGTLRGRMFHPEKLEWPARQFWIGDYIKKEHRRIMLRMKETLRNAFINVGSTDIIESRFDKGEYYVKITYTDYNYPNNSFEAKKVFEKAVHTYKENPDEFKRELVGWIIDVDSREFNWGTPEYFEKKYGVKG